MAVTFVTVCFIPKSKFESNFFCFFACFIFPKLDRIIVECENAELFDTMTEKENRFQEMFFAKIR